MIRLGARVTVGCAALLFLLAAGPALANGTTTTCPPVQVGAELTEPPELVAKGGMLETVFSVEMKTQCVPVQDANKNWVGQPMDLRTYVFPDPATGRPRWGYPGPTLRVRKPSKDGELGDGWAIRLLNKLPPDGGGACDSACPAGTVCPTDSSQLPDPTTCPCAPAPNNKCALCCCWVDNSQTYPDCFHGDNTTNLHFHGTHVSPQPPQDYVLLELRPLPEKGEPPQDAHPVHRGGVVAYGEYQYRVDPLLDTQAEGTHWYHPHKHGSVALQVGDGMPGALIVEGPFDDWLRGWYGGKLVEKLLVLQQIEQGTNLYPTTAEQVASFAAPPTLVNGLVSPKVTMRPGEVQRWRFVNATMQVASQLNVYFPADVTVKQIAMDGVRFARENYERQPLFDPANPKAFKISPGNRADFLVQAPVAPGTYAVTHDVFSQVSPRAERRLALRDEGLAPGPSLPPLVTLTVAEARPEGGGAPAPAATGFPPATQWPEMPWYLKDIPPSEIKGDPVSLVFNMADKQGNPSGPGSPATMFFINNIQYDPDCVNVTTAIGTARQWNISNTSPLAHPFHIHINPFQVVRDGTTTYQPPYVWQDTIALPKGTAQSPGSVELRQRYLMYTGEYVLHCHFLGHEDRGMMFGVQTTCPDDPTKFGKAHVGAAPECFAGNLIPAAPQCGTPAPAAGGRH